MRQATRKINDADSSYSKQDDGKQFSNRFQGKQDFVTKDGHYGIVKNTKNPIKKGGMSDMQKLHDDLDVYNSDFESPSKINSNQYVTANFPSPSKNLELSQSPKKVMHQKKVNSLGQAQPPPEQFIQNMFSSPVKITQHTEQTPQKSAQKFTNAQKYKDAFMNPAPEKKFSEPPVVVTKRSKPGSPNPRSKLIVNNELHQARLVNLNRPTGVENDPTRGSLDFMQNKRGFRNDPNGSHNLEGNRSMQLINRSIPINKSQSNLYENNTPHISPSNVLRNNSEFSRHNQNSRSTSILLPALNSKNVSSYEFNQQNMTSHSHGGPAAFINNKSSFYQRFMLNNRVAKTGNHFEQRTLSSDPYMTDFGSRGNNSAGVHQRSADFTIKPIMTTSGNKSLNNSKSLINVSQEVKPNQYINPYENGITIDSNIKSQRSIGNTIQAKENLRKKTLTDVQQSPANYGRIDTQALLEYGQQTHESGPGRRNISQKIQNIPKQNSSSINNKKNLRKNINKKNIFNQAQNSTIDHQAEATADFGQNSRINSGIWGQNDSNQDLNDENIDSIGRNLIYQQKTPKKQILTQSQNLKISKPKATPEKPVSSSLVNSKKIKLLTEQKRKGSYDMPSISNEQITQNFYNQNVIIMQNPNSGQGLFPVVNTSSFEPQQQPRKQIYQQLQSQVYNQNTPLKLGKKNNLNDLSFGN